MTTTQQPQTEFVRAISRLDATALVVGSMIGSGIFIVSAEILREVHAPGLLLVVWALSGVVTLMGALTYGEGAHQGDDARERPDDEQQARGVDFAQDLRRDDEDPRTDHRPHDERRGVEPGDGPDELGLRLLGRGHPVVLALGLGYRAS